MTGKTELKMSDARIVAGVWEGHLTGIGATVPELEVTHLGAALDGVEVVPGPEAGVTVRVPIPLAALHDGVQTFVIRADGTTLAHFSVIAGAALEDDIRAEVDLLRAELDLLKRAFRRHCVATAG